MPPVPLLKAFAAGQGWGGQGEVHAQPGRGCHPAEAVVCGWIVSRLQAYVAHRLCCGFALNSWHFFSCLGPSQPGTLACTWVRPRRPCLPRAGPPQPFLEPQAPVVICAVGTVAQRMARTPYCAHGDPSGALPVWKHGNPPTPAPACHPVSWPSAAEEQGPRAASLPLGAPAWRPHLGTPVLAQVPPHPAWAAPSPRPPHLPSWSVKQVCLALWGSTRHSPAWARP